VKGQNLHVLGGGIGLLNVAVDEGGDGAGSSVDLVLLLGDGQLAEKLLEGLEGLGVLGLDGRGVVKSSGGHGVGGRRGGGG
jgi:hypothetical protein